jgi:hypothetical protein
MAFSNGGQGHFSSSQMQRQASSLLRSKSFAWLPFREAAEPFLQDRIPQLAPLSVRTEREHTKMLNKRFGDMQVSRLTPENVIGAYASARTTGSQTPS